METTRAHLQVAVRSETCEDKAHSRSSRGKQDAQCYPSFAVIPVIFRLSLYLRPEPFLARRRSFSSGFILRYHHLVASRGISKSANHGGPCGQYPEPPYALSSACLVRSLESHSPHGIMTWPVSSSVYPGSTFSFLLSQIDLVRSVVGFMALILILSFPHKSLSSTCCSWLAPCYCCRASLVIIIRCLQCVFVFSVLLIHTHI